MLCGEFHRAPLGLHLSLSDTRSPYSSLLALIQGMAAITAHAAHEDEDIFLGKFMYLLQFKLNFTYDDTVTSTYDSLCTVIKRYVHQKDVMKYKNFSG